MDVDIDAEDGELMSLDDALLNLASDNDDEEASDDDKPEVKDSEEDAEVMVASEEITSLQEEAPTQTIHIPSSSAPERPKPGKLSVFPLSKVKMILRQDPDTQMVSSETSVLVAKAAELFAEHLSKQSFHITESSKRKTLAVKDVEAAVNSIPSLAFLDGVF